MTTVDARDEFVVDLVRDDDEAAAIAEVWDELADACGAGPFARPDYAMTWWQHLGRGRLLVVVVHRGDELVALAPLHERRAGPLGVARWLGHGLGTVAEALVRPGVHGAAEALWAALDSPSRVLQLVESRDGGGGLAELARRGARRGYAHRSARRDGCPVIDPLPSGAEAHLSAPARKSLRRSVRVARRRLAEAGSTWTVQVADDLPAWQALRPAVQTVYDEAERDRPRTHLLAGDWEPFTSAFLASMFARGRAVALVGTIDDRPTCFEIALLTGSTWSSWIGRFASGAAVRSPGHLLQAEALDLLPERGVRRLDLLLGEDDYKLRWATGGYDTLDVVHGRRAAIAVWDLAQRVGRTVASAAGRS